MTHKYIYSDWNPVCPFLLTKHVDMDGRLHTVRVWLADSFHHIQVNLSVTWWYRWRLLLVSVQQLIAMQRAGNLTAFLPHSHTNTPCRHSCLLIGIPPCAGKLSSKVLHLAGHCFYSAAWGIDLPCCSNYLSPDSLRGTLLTVKSNDGCVFKSDYYFIRCCVHYLNAQQSTHVCTSIMLVSIDGSL